MNDKLRALYEKISGDDSLKEAFKKGLESISDVDAKKSFIIDFAKEQGITLAMEDFPEAAGMDHVSDEELENVAGGDMGDAANAECQEAALAICIMFGGAAGLMDC